ncbi:hypothetical protein [Okeania sp. SIO3I5]|uniref:hypothetical protein n=1 Tax=Okeania sp. SIO3I5 TaxID=2607805 RepID=UPI0025E74A6B|nr:hypothetical protein [Okeania sp. SIO3I5]
MLGIDFMVSKSLIVKALRKNSKIFYQSQRFLKDNLKDFMIMITKQQILSEVVNQKEIRVIGMRRTGNHAIINWIKNQEIGNIEFLNDLKVNRNALRHSYENLSENYPFLKKDCLIRSYEDYSLQEITNWLLESKHDLYFGKSGTRYDVLIIRDPFNLLASRFKHRLQREKNDLDSTESCYGNNFLFVRSPHQKVSDLSLNYAKEDLGETSYIQKHNKICINYNQWFTDVDYRQQIAEKLQLKFSDTGIDKVSSRRR